MESPSAIYEKIREEALQVLQDEPELEFLLHATVLHESVTNFAEAIAMATCYRLLLAPCNSQGTTTVPSAAAVVFSPSTMNTILLECMTQDTHILEKGHTMQHAVVQDLLAVCRRDPAMNTPLQVILFSKGFSALVCHRAAYRVLKKGKKFMALFLQSQVSSMFGVDIHPGAQLGCALMLDHGTGIVMGETASVGDGCTFLHGVTLGGTGKVTGDRHPKVGNHVLIGANANLLGNIRIGDGVKVGAGSVVLRAIPSGATAVGVPAKIIGRASEAKPGSDVDGTLEDVKLFKSTRNVFKTTVSSSAVSSIPSTVSLSSNSSGTSDSDSSKEDTNTDDHTGNDNITSSGEYDPTSCPYRDYASPRTIPPGKMSLCHMHKVLNPLGFDSDAIFRCFFAMDTKNEGCVDVTLLQKKNGVLRNNLAINAAKAEQIVNVLVSSSTPAHHHQTMIPPHDVLQATEDDGFEF